MVAVVRRFAEALALGVRSRQRSAAARHRPRSAAIDMRWRRRPPQSAWRRRASRPKTTPGKTGSRRGDVRAVRTRDPSGRRTRKPPSSTAHWLRPRGRFAHTPMQIRPAAGPERPAPERTAIRRSRGAAWNGSLLASKARACYSSDVLAQASLLETQASRPDFRCGAHVVGFKLLG